MIIFLTYNGTNKNEAVVNDNTKYFLSRAEIKTYNVLIDRRNLYDQPINGLIKQYNEVTKVTIWQGYDYTTGCILDNAHWKTIMTNCNWFK